MRVIAWALLVLFYGLFSQEVVFVVPVQDLFPEKLSKHGTEHLYDYYNNYQSWSGFAQKYDCIRTAQVPMNTGGRLVEYDEATGEACIEFDTMLVDKRGFLEPCKFWTLSYCKYEESGVTKKNSTFIVLDDENKQKYETDAFPVRVRPDDISTLRAKNTIVLKKPWLDEITGKTYSAGTRLVRNSKKDTKKSYGVKLFDVCSSGVVAAKVPKKIARACDEVLSDDERRDLFNELLKSWSTHKKNKIIPYVWGGGVIMLPVVDNGFSIVEGSFFNTPTKYYERNNIGLPYGVDCSALILLAAGVAGIDYFYKTTSTLYNHGRPIKDFEDMQPGDIIVWPGHTIVISDMRAGKESCIESLGYEAGAGRVREVLLKKRFKDIYSYHDLWKAYVGHQLLEILYAHNSKVHKKIPEFKIVSLIG